MINNLRISLRRDGIKLVVASQGRPVEIRMSETKHFSPLKTTFPRYEGSIPFTRSIDYQSLTRNCKRCPLRNVLFWPGETSLIPRQLKVVLLRESQAFAIN